MPTIKLGEQGQIEIPNVLRQALNWNPGTILKVTVVEGNQMILVGPKKRAKQESLDDKLERSLEQADRGETFGPFETHDVLIECLHDQRNEN